MMFPIEVENLSHAYGDRSALADVSFCVKTGEIFAFLGPNGSGKTTLFKILTTFIPVECGEVTLLGHNLARDSSPVRQHLGVVFQHPSLDLKLTVTENLRHHGHLYGIWGADLKRRIRDVLGLHELDDRGDDLVETLSGGLRRRAEIAKTMLPRPRLLLLDEPSAGLDPIARRRLLGFLNNLCVSEEVTVVLTTHILDEAETCDRVGILNSGELVAVGTPDGLRDHISGDIVTIDSPAPDQLAPKINRQYGCKVASVEGMLRIECDGGHEFVRDVVAAFPSDIRSARFGKPTLEDVFIKLTGRRFEL
ncbi:MAG: ABC transporter ATP-binding protein [Candidatus Poribacteria bacterium]|nr:ABC transporter ATP-binding protein [Candidatus Poribacteria bacterium]MDE0502821.1 ABC transporter ATP-binding protein [Candidatus Poribacteria bacterium]